MRWAKLAKSVAVLAVAAGVGTAGYFTRDHWLPWVVPAPQADAHDDHGPETTAAAEQVTLSPQAQKNLRLVSRPLQPETFWKTVSVPGLVIDRPGVGDRNVIAPVTGVVSRIHRVAGATVKPGDVLFTLKLLSEAVHLTQTELFKASQDLKLAEEQKKRLTATAGAVAEARLIEADNQITRLEVAIKAYRQELLTRGIPADQTDGVMKGTFVSEIPIVAPSPPEARTGAAVAYEVQELKVDLGQQVQAGQTLSLLSNHQALAVEGRAFRDESPLIERAMREGWPVVVDFAEDAAADWPTLAQPFPVTYLANTIDPDSRTFRFLMPLDNQSRVIERDGRTHVLWRFRPGQRVRVRVRVEAVPNVFVLPTDAVARDGAEAYVFRQNGDSFDRKPVQVVYRDREHAVVANDGSVLPGVFVAQTGAAQLNRMAKSRSGTAPEGFHVHADGSVHMGKH